MIRQVHVAVPTACFDDDLAALVDEHGFRLDAIFPADAPATAIVSGHGVTLRFERTAAGEPARLHLLTDDPDVLARGAVTLPGGTALTPRPFTTSYELPENRPSLTITHDDRAAGPGRAGMRYRDLIPDRWGGRFIASHITIPDDGPVPDYVHFHKIRFQMIFVKSGWVKVVYEDQGDPFVMTPGDCVLQPSEIRHRVLESSVGLEVLEIGCPAEHETVADHTTDLPTGAIDPDRVWDGQGFVRHVAADATWLPWRSPGWEHRDTGIGAATGGLAGVRVARPSEGPPPPSNGSTALDTEFAMFVVLHGEVTFEADGIGPEHLAAGSSVAIPGGVPHRLTEPTADLELLDVTLPAEPSRRSSL